MQQDHLKISPAPKTHIAIMRKSWGLLPKIESGKKTIESRWYEKMSEPWDNIYPGDTVYFKNAGEPVILKTEVADIIQYSDLTTKNVKDLLDQYAEQDGIDPEKKIEYFQRFKGKKYCILIFLKNPQKITPFTIDKTGFGTMSAWITIDNIDKIKISSEPKIVQNRLIR